MSNRNQGFTLIELIVTLTILGIAVAIAVAAFGEVIERNRQEALKDEIENALSYYQATFLSEIPRLYRDLEEGLGEAAAEGICIWCCFTTRL